MDHTTFPGLFARRMKDDECYFSKKDFITTIHSLFNNYSLSNETAIEVIDTHRAYPYYDKNRDTIVIDTHFFDILHIVSAIIFSGNDEYMDALADRCAADYFLCKDEIHIALHYANLFSQKKEALERILQKYSRQINNSFFRQLMFVLAHEQGHALLNYNGNDERFIPFSYYFDKEFEKITSVDRIILSVDISPIKEDLDTLGSTLLDEVCDYSDESITKLRKHGMQFASVVQKGLEVLEIPESDMLSKEEIAYYACDLYLKDGGIKLLKRDRYKNDCIIDGYALQRLVACNINDENRLSQMRDAAFAYFSCLLTIDIITCVNACVMNYRHEAYKDEDLVWNRMRLERDIFNNIMQQYAYRDPYGLFLAAELFDYAEELLDSYNTLYARFCDRIYAVIHPTENTPYCPCGCEEYEQLYSQVHTLLSIKLGMEGTE